MLLQNSREIRLTDIDGDENTGNRSKKSGPGMAGHGFTGSVRPTRFGILFWGLRRAEGEIDNLGGQPDSGQ